MLRILKRLLSYFYEDAFDVDEPAGGRHRPSATSHLFRKEEPQTTKRNPARSGTGGANRGAARQKPAANPDFDPYNTGKFDRGASWERISKKQR